MNSEKVYSTRSKLLIIMNDKRRTTQISFITIHNAKNKRNVENCVEHYFWLTSNRTAIDQHAMQFR